MTRKVAYILVTKVGPSREAQERAIAKAGHKAAVVYCDDLSARRRKADHVHPDQDLMLRQMRGGETIAVASPGRVGLTKEHVLAVLKAVEKKGGTVFDASSGHTLRWSPEVEAATMFVDRAYHEHKAQQLAAARAVKAAAGGPSGPREKPFRLSKDEVTRMWHNQIDYPNRFMIAAMAGVSARTLAKRLGPRTGKPGKSKGKAK